MRSVSIVSFMTAISRVLGLVREQVMAYYFGTSLLKSAFDLAFIVPNLFRRLFGEGALSSAFVPIFSETLAKDGRVRAFTLARRVFALLAVALGVITLLGILLTYPLATWLPPESRWIAPLPMLRIMLPYALLICIAALLSGMLNALGRFAIPALTPFLLNAIWIIALVVVAPLISRLPEARMMVLSWAILFAGLAQILFQLPLLRREGLGWFLFHFRGLFADPQLRRVLKLMAPAALGFGIIQINVCLDKMLAFWADPTAPGALEYAERIVYLPLGMFGTAFMTVLLPTFSHQAARGDHGAMAATLERAIRNLAVIMVPCSAALMVLALPIITLIYQFKGGSFDDASAIMSSRALIAYAPGLLVFSLQKAQTPLFYGLQDLKTPVVVSLLGLLLNVTLNISSVILLPMGWKHVGIAGSTVLTSLINGVILALILRKRVGAPRMGGILAPILRAVVAASVMVLGAWQAQRWLLVGASAHLPGKFAELVAMFGAVLGGVAVYAIVMWFISRAELREMLGDFHPRFRRGQRE